MEKEYEIIAVSPDHLEKVEETFSRCFGYSPVSGYFHKKFYENPAGDLVGFAAMHGGDLAAFYGVIPEEYVAADQKVIIHESMDTMTHPEYRRQGLFSRLVKRTFDHLIERDGKIYVLGFPGTMSHGGLIKAGWKDIVDIPFLFLPRPLFAVRRLGSRSTRTSIAPVDSFDEGFGTYFDKKIYAANKITKYLDPKFLNWRISSHSAFKFQGVKIMSGNEIIGLVVYRIDEKERCFIQLLDLAQGSDAADIIGDVCDFLFNKTGSSFVYTFEPDDQGLKNAFRRNWFIKNNFGRGPFSYQPPLSGYSDEQYLNGLNFFSGDSYTIQPIMRDY